MWYVKHEQQSGGQPSTCITLFEGLNSLLLCVTQLQHVIVHHVYMSGNPSIVEETGFGEGEKGYAALQCAMSEYEGDPLINQYAAAAMGKVWEAAGLPMMNGAN